MRHGIARAVGVVLAAFLLACRPHPAEDVLALYDGGEVTRAELDRRVLSHPADARRPADGDFPTWYTSLVRQQAADEILLAEAEAGGATGDAEFAASWETARRQLLASVLVQRHRRASAEQPLLEDEVRAYFEEHRGELVQAARREVLHAYLRRRDGEASGALRRRAAELRSRVAAGESFEAMARRFSDSESRHRGGALGWIGREDLAPEAAAVVFALTEGELSEPVVTADGAHLFLVRQAMGDRTYALDEVRELVVRRMQAERVARLIAELVAGVEVPADTFVPSSAELETLLAAGDDEALALRVGEASVTVGELRERLRGERTEGRTSGAAELLQSIDQRVRLALRAEREGLDREAEVTERLAALRRGLLLESHRRRRLRDWVAADAPLLRSHYEANLGQFATPLRLELEILVVPEGADANARMAELEAARERLDAGETTLEELATRWEGAVRETGRVALPELRSAAPKLAAIAAGVAAGRHTPPFAAGQGQLELARVKAREEPRPEPLEAVRDRVADHLLETRGAELYERMLGELLDRARYRGLPDRLAALPAPRTGEP